ncbi:MAG: DUF4401 domain-containing protein [Planctomycetes bacterium]|nr:DUF4401 domain-containing protein [Planctomycetota bacterium]
MQTADERLTLRELLGRLQQRGLLDADQASAIAEHQAWRIGSSGEPWFVHALLAAGAWVAAICFIVCLGIADLLDDEAFSLLGWGAAFLTGATVLRYFANHVFPVQLALAVSLAGHGFVLTGAGELADHVAGVAVAAVLLCILLYPLYRDALHRFLSCLLASGCVTAWLVMDGVAEVVHVTILGKIVTVGLAFMYRSDFSWLRPLGYAMALSIPANLFLVLLPEDTVAVHWWPANVVLTASLIWLYQWAAGGWDRFREEPLVVAVVATVCLAAVTTPGVLAAVGLLVLGYARRDPYVLGMGTAFFPAFIVVFYYEMETDLLAKSWILMASGAVLLAARWYLGRRGWAVE